MNKGPVRRNPRTDPSAGNRHQSECESMIAANSARRFVLDPSPAILPTFGREPEHGLAEQGKFCLVPRPATKTPLTNVRVPEARVSQSYYGRLEAGDAIEAN